MNRAEEYLLASRASLTAGRLNVAYEEARTAAELVAKAILASAKGSYPREHNVAGELLAAKRIPPGMSAKKLSAFLGDFSRGTYGFHQPLERKEVKDGIDMAAALLHEVRP